LDVPEMDGKPTPPAKFIVLRPPFAVDGGRG